MTQVKRLIPQSDHDNIIRPLLIESHDLEVAKLDAAAKAIKRFINNIYGNYFTDQSPLGMAIDSGIMVLPKQQGGEFKVEIKKI